NERNGPALDRNPKRTALRSKRQETKSPRSFLPGGWKVAGSTISRPVWIPAVSWIVPPSGRTMRKSGSDSGRTTHSRPRALTSAPGANVILYASPLFLFRSPSASHNHGNALFAYLVGPYQQNIPAVVFADRLFLVSV